MTGHITLKKAFFDKTLGEGVFPENRYFERPEAEVTFQQPGCDPISYKGEPPDDAHQRIVTNKPFFQITNNRGGVAISIGMIFDQKNATAGTPDSCTAMTINAISHQHGDFVINVSLTGLGLRYPSEEGALTKTLQIAGEVVENIKNDEPVDFENVRDRLISEAGLTKVLPILVELKGSGVGRQKPAPQAASLEP